MGLVRPMRHVRSANTVYNFMQLRNLLKAEQKILINNSQLKNINKDTKNHTYTIDYAIRQLSANFKSAVTNLKNGNIKKFRLKYWKHTHPSKTIEIEKQYLRKNKICPNILGDIKYEYNNATYELPKITCNVKINYNDITKEYLLLIPVKK
jgi:DNA modification methylase